jgi:hypothetical protein
MKVPYMAVHVIQALIKSGQHVRKFLASHKIPRTWCIEFPCNWFEETIKLQIFPYVVGQAFQSLLFIDEVLALLLEGRGLGINRLK